MHPFNAFKKRRKHKKMIIHTSPSFRIYFGGRHDKLMQAYYRNLPADIPILELDPFAKLKKIMQLKNLMFSSQIHSDEGFAVDEQFLMTTLPFKKDGDFFVTNKPHIGLGIMAADCLPIVYYDQRNHVCAIAHAGWRGSVEGIAVKTLEKMGELYGTKAENVSVYFGPCMKVCCYEVTAEFKEHLAGFEPINRFILEHGGTLHFDLPRLNKIELEAAGIKKEALHLEYNVCTVCEADTFYSNRREKEDAGRQMTVVVLL